MLPSTLGLWGFQVQVLFHGGKGSKFSGKLKIRTWQGVSREQVGVN